MNKKKETDRLTGPSKAKNRNQLNLFLKTGRVILKKVTENKKSETKIPHTKQQVNEKVAIGYYLKEHKMLQQAKQEAEIILMDAFRQSEEMYQEVQKDIKKAKQEVELKKRHSFEQYNKEIIEAKKITQKAEQKADNIIASTHLKATQAEEELLLKKAVFQQEIDRELEKLVKEKEWFELYQQQVQETIERKEKVLFLESRKKIEYEQVEKEKLQNKINYLKIVNAKRKINSYRIGLAIFGCAVILSTLLSLFRQSIPVVSFINLCLVFVIACLAFALVYINLADGKNEQKIKRICSQNASLIDKNKEFVEIIDNLEKDAKKLIKEKIELERTKRHSQDNIEFLKIMQADLKNSEMYRRVLESENAALRKHLINV